MELKAEIRDFLPSRRATSRPTKPGSPPTAPGAAALVSNGSHDIIAADRLGEALWSPLYTGFDRSVNSARYLFLDPTAREGSIPRHGGIRADGSKGREGPRSLVG